MIIRKLESLRATLNAGDADLEHLSRCISCPPVTGNSCLARPSVTPLQCFFPLLSHRRKLLIGKITVSCKNMPLELRHVVVPQLCSLTVQRTRASEVSVRSSTSTFLHHETHLFGSPNKLCKLSNTLLTSILAAHFSFKMSRQILPEKSMLGW